MKFPLLVDIEPFDLNHTVLLKFHTKILSTNEPKCNCIGLNNNFLCLESSKSFIYHADPNLILLEDPIFTKMENFASQKQAKSKLAHFCEVEYSINTLIKLIKYNMVLKENTFQICNGQALLLIFTIIQGDPNLNLLLQMTITLKICVFDQMLMKQNGFGRCNTNIVFIFQLFVYNFWLFDNNLIFKMNLHTPPKCISLLVITFMGSKAYFKSNNYLKQQILIWSPCM